VAVTEVGAVTVRVTAAPERGKANAAVVEALAEALNMPASAVEIVRGHGARDKVVLVQGLTLEEVLERLKALATGPPPRRSG
jgi:uncharacterized protein YggU (UPF0235/DUF167 family)